MLGNIIGSGWEAVPSKDGLVGVIGLRFILSRSNSLCQRHDGACRCKSKLPGKIVGGGECTRLLRWAAGTRCRTAIRSWSGRNIYTWVNMDLHQCTGYREKGGRLLRMTPREADTVGRRGMAVAQVLSISSRHCKPMQARDSRSASGEAPTKVRLAGGEGGRSIDGKAERRCCTGPKAAALGRYGHWTGLHGAVVNAENPRQMIKALGSETRRLLGAKQFINDLCMPMRSGHRAKKRERESQIVCSVGHVGLVGYNILRFNLGIDQSSKTKKAATQTPSYMSHV